MPRKVTIGQKGGNVDARCREDGKQGHRADQRETFGLIGPQTAGEGHVTLTDEAGLVIAVAVLMRRAETAA